MKMTDDIVTRLRAMDMSCWHNAHHNISKCPDCAERHEAADELERLYAQIDSEDAQAYRALRRLYDNERERANELLEERDHWRTAYDQLRMARIDVKAAEDITAAVKNILNATRRMYDIYLLSNENAPYEETMRTIEADMFGPEEDRSGTQP